MRYQKDLTHRAIAIFLEAIDTKLTQLIKQRAQEEMKVKHNEKFSDDEFDEAMKDEQLNLQVQKHISQGSIKLVHKDSGEQVCVEETNLLKDKGRTALANIDESIDYERDHDPMEANLHVAEPAEKELTELVTKIVRRNSSLKRGDTVESPIL
jgi:hypothetical protein